MFEEKKIFLLERCTDKISETVMEICEDVTEDLIIINCGLLEKKSKLRKNIEDSKKAVIIPTYKDKEAGEFVRPGQEFVTQGINF